jgi:nicotinamidase-related amidase
MSENLNATLIEDPERSAVLILDYQSGIVDMIARDSAQLLLNASALLDAARRKQLKIIYVMVGFRPGYPEVSPMNMSFSAIKQSQRFAPNSAGSEIHPRVAPNLASGDVVVIKHRVGAFSGTDLEMILRANQVHTLVLFGLATSGVVLSTLRHAADADYRCIVVKDLCGDQDEEVHRVLTDKVFARQARVVTATEILTALN